MSRLEFAPKIDGIKITDIKRGLGSFSPKPDKAVSFAVLKEALKKAGYTLASAEITVSGKLAHDDSGWWLVVDPSKQRFALEGANLNQVLADSAPGSRVEITGGWETSSEGAVGREVIRPRTAQRAAITREASSFALVAFRDIESSMPESTVESGVFLTPIRTTSPGLTVYKGGAIIARYSFSSQHLGNLQVDRQGIRLNASYTPTPTLQLEAEVPYQRISYDNGPNSGSGRGFGNFIVWGKYRFFRTLETWGDRQAAVRFGIELPTGKKDGPKPEKLPAAEFVRQQLTPIAGGLSAHADASYSQAKGRFVYGGNLEGILRSDRSGFRLGNEIRANTDLEYVLLPLKYRSPTQELFLIFETTFVHRWRGRASGVTVPGSSSSEFYFAPALQYTATERFLIEVSLQLPVVINAGPQVLRTERNLLIGVRYLY